MYTVGVIKVMARDMTILRMFSYVSDLQLKSYYLTYYLALCGVVWGCVHLCKEQSPTTLTDDGARYYFLPLVMAAMR